MLKLNLQQVPFWLDLSSGVSVLVKPLSTAIMNAAQSVAKQRLNRVRALREELIAGGGDARDLPDFDDDDIRKAWVETELTKALARSAIAAWKGVYTAEGSEPAPLSDTHIDELMDVWFIATEFFDKYLGSLELLDAEGNGSRPAANGTSAAGQPIAEAATNSNSPAAGAKKVRLPKNTALMTRASR